MARLKLWFVKQINEPPGHDYYDSAVVVASSAEVARKVHPRHGVQNHLATHPRNFYDWALPEGLTATLIGVADKTYDLEGEVICSSFNAG